MAKKTFYFFYYFFSIAIFGLLICTYFSNNKSEKEFEALKASRLNTFIDAGLTVYADEVPVGKVTTKIVDDTDSFRIGDTKYGIEPLLDQGYIMLIDGVIEPNENASLDSIMSSYYAYEVRVNDKTIMLKKR